MVKSPNWKEEELILVLDLYLKHNLKWLNGASEKTDEIMKMSNLLRKLDIFDENIKKISNFRSPSSIHMKLMNFKALDPKYSKNGLSNVSALDKKVWSEYSNDPIKLQINVEKVMMNNQKEIGRSKPNDVNENIEHRLKECLNCMVNYNNQCNLIRKNAIEISDLHTSQKIINCMVKCLTFSSENIKELEEIITEISSNNKVKESHTNERIGKYVQRTFSELINLNTFTDDDIKNLLEIDFSKKKFHINLAFIKEIDENIPLNMQLKVGKYQRYWKKAFTINNKKYLICKEWYESNRIYYDSWLNSLKTCNF